MTLTNYWWLLIWLATMGIGLAATCPQQPVQVLGRTEYRWGMGAAILLASPYVIWAMNRSNFGDSEVYRKTFLEVPRSLGELPAYLSEHTKDQGFSVLTALIKTVIGNNDKLFFLIIAIFQMFCIVYFFRKYSTNFLFSMFMFIASTDYLSWMFNGMRQFIAVCAALLAFDLLMKKKYIPAICVILLVSQIHGSALIMLPILLVIQGKAWNRKTLLMLVAVITCVFFIDQFTSVLNDTLAETQYSDIVTNEIWVNDDGTNTLRILFYSIPAILSLIGRKYLKQADSPEINLCVNCAVVTSILYILSGVSSGIYVGRLPIYTTLPGYVVVPWLIDHIFSKELAGFVKMGMVGVFLVFFYYQLHVAWGTI